MATSEVSPLPFFQGMRLKFAGTIFCIMGGSFPDLHSYLWQFLKCAPDYLSIGIRTPFSFAHLMASS